MFFPGISHIHGEFSDGLVQTWVAVPLLEAQYLCDGASFAEEIEYAF